MEEIKITLPIEPVTKKNHGQIIYNKTLGRAMLVPSAQYRSYEKACGYFIRCKRLNLNQPLNIKCLYYMKTRRTVDLCNLLGATMDVLVNYGVIADDNCRIAVSHDGSRVFYDKVAPRTEIYITQAEITDKSEMAVQEVPKPTKKKRCQSR